jgi:hypothetical protein
MLVIELDAPQSAEQRAINNYRTAIRFRDKEADSIVESLLELLTACRGVRGKFEVRPFIRDIFNGTKQA